MYTKGVYFLDIRNIVVSSYKMTLLPLKEEAVIAKSIEFFSDPEPCFLHRGAVITRILTEIDDYLLNASKNGSREMLWSDFPEKYRVLLEIGGEVHGIRFEIDGKIAAPKARKA